MKKVKFCVSLIISQEIELEVNDDIDDDELDGLVLDAVDYPMGVVEYDPHEDEWVLDDVSVTQL